VIDYTSIKIYGDAGKKDCTSGKFFTLPAKMIVLPVENFALSVKFIALPAERIVYLIKTLILRNNYM